MKYLLPRIGVTLIVLGTVGGILGAVSSAPAATTPLVYVCQQLPCQFGQELEVFDPHGAPIFSVGETGGAGVFGDPFHVLVPGSVTHSGVTLAWESPAAYDLAHHLPTSCVVPGVWLEPGGLWVCSAGQWVRKVAL